MENLRKTYEWRWLIWNIFHLLFQSLGKCIGKARKLENECIFRGFRVVTYPSPIKTTMVSKICWLITRILSFLIFYHIIKHCLVPIKKFLRVNRLLLPNFLLHFPFPKRGKLILTTKIKKGRRVSEATDYRISIKAWKLSFYFICKN